MDGNQTISSTPSAPPAHGGISLSSLFPAADSSFGVPVTPTEDNQTRGNDEGMDLDTENNNDDRDALSSPATSLASTLAPLAPSTSTNPKSKGKAVAKPAKRVGGSRVTEKKSPSSVSKGKRKAKEVDDVEAVPEVAADDDIRCAEEQEMAIGVGEEPKDLLNKSNKAIRKGGAPIHNTAVDAIASVFAKAGLDDLTAKGEATALLVEIKSGARAHQPEAFASDVADRIEVINQYRETLASQINVEEAKVYGDEYRELDGSHKMTPPPTEFGPAALVLSNWRPGETYGKDVDVKIGTERAQTEKDWVRLGVRQPGFSQHDRAQHLFPKSCSGSQPHTTFYTAEGRKTLDDIEAEIVEHAVVQGLPVLVYGHDALVDLTSNPHVSVETTYLERKWIGARDIAQGDAVTEHATIRLLVLSHTLHPELKTLGLALPAPCAFSGRGASHQQQRDADAAHAIFWSLLAPSSLSRPAEQHYFERTYAVYTAPSDYAESIGKMVYNAKREGRIFGDYELQPAVLRYAAYNAAELDKIKSDGAVIARQPNLDSRLARSILELCKELMVGRSIAKKVFYRDLRSRRNISAGESGALTDEEATALEQKEAFNDRYQAWLKKLAVEKPEIYKQLKEKKAAYDFNRYHNEGGKAKRAERYYNSGEREENKRRYREDEGKMGHSHILAVSIPSGRSLNRQDRYYINNRGGKEKRQQARLQAIKPDFGQLFPYLNYTADELEEKYTRKVLKTLLAYGVELLFAEHKKSVYAEKLRTLMNKRSTAIKQAHASSASSLASSSLNTVKSEAEQQKKKKVKPAQQQKKPQQQEAELAPKKKKGVESPGGASLKAQKSIGASAAPKTPSAASRNGDSSSGGSLAELKPQQKGSSSGAIAFVASAVAASVQSSTSRTGGASGAVSGGESSSSSARGSGSGSSSASSARGVSSSSGSGASSGSGVTSSGVIAQDQMTLEPQAKAFVAQPSKLLKAQPATPLEPQAAKPHKKQPAKPLKTIPSNMLAMSGGKLCGSDSLKKRKGKSKRKAGSLGSAANKLAKVRDGDKSAGVKSEEVKKKKGDGKDKK
ncbi:hypothetical protein JCM10450v2_000336 [Rhodotorula kratochvilovae]